MKISIFGAGSEFTHNIVSDILGIEGLEGGEFALIDIDPLRLKSARWLVEQLVVLSGKKFSVKASTHRREVMSGSDFVINQIEVMGLKTVRNEFEIPLKYGINQCIGDTMGPGGLFKTLRTLPDWLAILKDVEELCPDCRILNYTNPMSAVTLATVRSSSLPVVGLCHSVQETTQQLAEYLEIPCEELEFDCAGINHLSWMIKLRHKGVDLYPELIRRCSDPEFLKKDPVRFDFMLYSGCFVTESSGHFSEYVPYYRKRQDLIERYCSVGYNGGTGFYANEWPIWRQDRDDKIERQLKGEEVVELTPSDEYAAVIIESVYKNKPEVIYGNVENRGLIENLPLNGVVEVACLVDRNGISPVRFGRLPEHLAAICRSNMAFFELVVQSVLNNDRDAAFHALMLDPLTSAVLSPGEIKSLFEELWEADKAYIPDMR